MGSSGTIDFIATVTDGNEVVDDESLPFNAQTPTGTLPDGPIDRDTGMLDEMASETPDEDLANADAQVGNDVMLVSQAPPQGPAAPNVLQIQTNRALPDVYYEQALAVADVAKLQTLRKVYHNRIDVADKIARLAMNFAKYFQVMMKTEVEIDLGVLKVKSYVLKAVWDHQAEAVGIGKADIIATLNATSLAHVGEMIRLDTSLSNIDAAIATLILNPPK